VATLDDRRPHLDNVFDFTDEGERGGIDDLEATPPRHIATGTMPRLQLGEGREVEPPDSPRATTRMSVEEVLELRAVSLEARRQAARVETAPLDVPEPAPVMPAALPHILVPMPPADWRQRWARVRSRAKATGSRLAGRTWRGRELAAAFAAGILFGLLAAC
jgi:hypothetical protein